ncbi:FAD-binding oxidoreductase [Haloarcula sp. CBA1130]|uniref:FAD-binding and (Fe-S)-binding domain-containing protein n=1 Tax=unclassified Haloarcula TaxID=2624677 RepID=UPI0012441E1D|nr:MULTISPECIES: FAD-binding and (Fe-S)-binding domain-containing protein [unclassified Haloarcula]KAA9396725.1 FAD-binding oxidoreductase [Haloarcula sp. CBA1129]KAA9401686.1 FAD-binding oxidoreductase [Haloarcula sp. CBA1130]
MAIENVEDTWSAQELDLSRPDVDAYRDLAEALRSQVSGGVEFDEYARVLYATDGSIYRAEPAGVVYPTDVSDVQAAVAVATNHGVPILPRGTGSSLAGQTVGPGCVVLDMSRHMDDILDVRPDEQTAHIQPGVVQDDLDDALADYGLKFAPDPASSNRATVGGGIGNNSTGAHSVRYGITDAYTDAVKAVLSDGSLIHAREVVIDSPEWDDIVGKDDREAEIYRTVREVVEENADEIEARYPDLKRRVSGYNLDRVVYENDDGERVLNLAKLFVGSEGTLGVIVEAELSLVTVPEETALALYCFDTLADAMKAVPVALDYDVSAVELMDDEVFRLAAGSDGYAEYVDPIPERAAAALMLEYDSELHDDFEAAIARTTERFVDDGEAFDVVEAYTEADQADLWKLRKAAIPLLMSMDGDPKPYPFIEDATVPPAELAEYVDKFEDVLADHDTSAAYFAHAGSGTLHIRPILNLKEMSGIEDMHSITDDVTDLVLEHNGSFSGEHGDGMARTEFTPKMYGETLWDAFKEVKTAFDPQWWMHPGNVVYREGPADIGPDADRGVGADMRENLRYGPDYQSLEPQTTLDFEDEGGFSELVELCNGCGTCRQTDGDVMCPTYRASEEEVQTTRGRANLLRSAISGDLDEDEMHSDRFQEEVLDLCVGCKGCKSDCPTGVDMAKLKTELKHQHHEAEGASRRERLFANIDTASKIGSALAPVSNWATAIPGARVVMQKLFGIAPERDLPPFRRETLQDWFDARGGSTVSQAEADRKVLLFPDTYTNYSYPAAGKAAIETLEAAGVHVTIADDTAPSGRAAYSTGMLDLARERAETNTTRLSDRVAEGWDVVFVEPSDAVMFQDEYRDLLDGPAVSQVADSAYGVLEYLDTFRLDDALPVEDRSLGTAGSVSYHGHCNQKGTNKDHHAVGVMRRVGYDVDPLDSTCCGMAGSFGYHDEHYDLSKTIGRLLFDKVDESDGDRVVAPGGSCRSQLGDRDGVEEIPPHPIEVVAEQLTDTATAQRSV